jgi:hypothetical protein
MGRCCAAGVQVTVITARKSLKGVNHEGHEGTLRKPIGLFLGLDFRASLRGLLVRLRESQDCCFVEVLA